MSWNFSPRVSRRCWTATSVALAVLINSAVAGERTIERQTGVYDTSNPAKNLARMNCGAAIDLIGPDGRSVVVTNKNSSARELLFDDDTLNYPLAEGNTTFVVSFPRISTLDRFPFVNENSDAEGEMKIEEC